MKELIGHALSVFMGFFAIMNPIANTPIFLGLTADDPPAIRRRVALKAVVTAFVIILVFVLAGKAIFQLFGITLPAFRITGGILVALIGYNMLHGEKSSAHHPSEGAGETNLQTALSVAVTPLALPILAGPGTIATAMNYASADGIPEMIITVVAFALLCLITYLFFVSGERIIRLLGQAGMDVITRVMGLILAVIGVQMLVNGIAGAVKAAGG